MYDERKNYKLKVIGNESIDIQWDMEGKYK